jgi:hypothetical protein
MHDTQPDTAPAPTPVDKNAPADRRCPRCGTDNLCALAAGQSSGQCWCMRQPLNVPLPAAAPASCYCASCLAAIAATIDDVSDAR